MGNIFGAIGLAIIGLFVGVTAVNDDFAINIGGNTQMASVEEAVDDKKDESSTEDTKTDEGKTEESKDEGASEESKSTEESKDDTKTEESTEESKDGGDTKTDEESKDTETSEESKSTEESKDDTKTEESTEESKDGESTEESKTEEESKDESKDESEEAKSTEDSIVLKTLGYSSGEGKSTMHVTFAQTVDGESWVQYDTSDKFEAPFTVNYGNRTAGEYFFTVEDMACDTTFAVRAVIKVDGIETYSGTQYLGTSTCDTESKDGDSKEEDKGDEEKKDDESPSVVDITSLGNSGDTVYVTWEQVTDGDVWVEYGTEKQAKPNITATATNPAGKYSVEISGLSCGETYFVRAVLKDSKEETHYSDSSSIMVEACDGDSKGDDKDSEGSGDTDTSKVEQVDLQDVQGTQMNVVFIQKTEADHRIEYGYDGVTFPYATDLQSEKPADKYSILVDNLKCETAYYARVALTDKDGTSYSESAKTITASCDADASDDKEEEKKDDDKEEKVEESSDAIKLTQWKTAANGDGTWVAAIVFKQGVQGDNWIQYIKDGDKDTLTKSMVQGDKPADTYVIELDKLACESTYEFQAVVQSEKGDYYTDLEKLETGNCKKEVTKTSTVSARSYAKVSNDAVAITTTTAKTNADGTVSTVTLTKNSESGAAVSQAVQVRQQYAKEVKALTEKLEIVSSDTTYATEDVDYIKKEINDIVAKMAVLSDVVQAANNAGSRNNSPVADTTDAGNSNTGSNEGGSSNNTADSKEADRPLLERRIVNRGNRGASVGELQSFLNTHVDANLVVDNAFGPLTEAAVKAFQEKHGLEIDGIVGPKTLALLEAFLQN